MQRQHRGDRAVIIGDEQAPALLDLLRNARAQFGQQELAGVLEPGGSPAVHPDAGDLVIFLWPGGADDGRWHSTSLREQRLSPAFAGDDEAYEMGRQKKNPRDVIAGVPSTSIDSGKLFRREVEAVRVHDLGPCLDEVLG